MRASHAWLSQLLGTDLSPESIAETLTSGGIEVEHQQHRGRHLRDIIVAKVISWEKHPERKKLSLVRLFDGQSERSVVCGAPNVPGPGGLVAYAPVGSTLPNGMKIETRALGGSKSEGMLCSEYELDLGPDEDGIMVLDSQEGFTAGQSLSDIWDFEDVIFELGLTPNRPDCLGHIGLARDIAALLGLQCDPWQQALRSLSADDPTVITESWHAQGTLPLLEAKRSSKGSSAHRCSVEIKNTTACPRYSAALITKLKIKRSPQALRTRLHWLGERPINNVVDTTNWIWLLTSHPIHAFDYDRIEGHKIIIDNAKSGQKLVTLDNQMRALQSDDLLICDATHPIALAGIMGGQNSEIDDNTHTALIECAYFLPTTVRRTSKRLGMHTQASHRFERGIDPNDHHKVLELALRQLGQLTGGVAYHQGLDVYPQLIEAVEISLQPERIEQVLALQVPKSQIKSHLQRLGCTIDDTCMPWKVSAPTWRPDIVRQIDLVEEVGRLEGYDKIEETLPNTRNQIDPQHQQRAKLLKDIRHAASSAGFAETINYAFCSEKALQAIEGDRPRVQIQNPLTEERSVMRSSLLPGLAAAMSQAQRHQVESIALYELGKIFRPNDNADLPEESLLIDLLIVGPAQRKLGTQSPADFFDMSGRVDFLIRSLCPHLPKLEPAGNAFPLPQIFHPRKSALISLCDQPLGYMGQLHPDIIEALSLNGCPVYASIAVDALRLALRQAGMPTSRPLPKFPAITRDLSLLVAEGTYASELVLALKRAQEPLLQEVTIVDEYRGENVKAGTKSITLRLCYRSNQATLTDAEADAAHAQLHNLVLKSASLGQR